MGGSLSEALYLRGKNCMFKHYGVIYVDQIILVLVEELRVRLALYKIRNLIEEILYLGNDLFILLLGEERIYEVKTDDRSVLIFIHV